MSNENYVNYYVEILSDTLKEQVLHNISLKANSRITEDILVNLRETVDKLTSANETLGNELDNLKKSQSERENNRIKELETTNNNLNTELQTLRASLVEYNNIKHQVQHVDTFRNELQKERIDHQKTRDEYESKIKITNDNYESKIKVLNDTIEYLQLTPAKRKKVDDLKATINTVVENNTDKDGGSF